MGLRKLLYVFGFIFTLLFSLKSTAFATDKGTTVKKGTASWYGSKYHGRRSSNGEIFNKNSLTAAHPSLPFGTEVKVTNLSNNMSVIVRITDRGPFGKHRIIDISEAAARKIDMYRAGVATVTMEVLSKPASEVPVIADAAVAATDSAGIPDVYYVIQAGAFSDLKNAELQSEKIKAIQTDLPVILTEEKVGGKTIHRVLAGRFADRKEADRIKVTLEKAGLSTLVRQGNG